MDSRVDLKSMYVSLVDSLNCIICQDTLKDSRDLSCGHTYCLACLEEYVDAVKDCGTTIECCQCKKKTAIPSPGGLKDLKQNFKLNCILEEQEKILGQFRERERQDSLRQREATIQIFVRNMEGKNLSFMVRLSDSTRSLKQQLQRKSGYPVNEQVLIYGGKPMNDETALKEYGIERMSTVQLSFRGKAGGFFDTYTAVVQLLTIV